MQIQIGMKETLVVPFCFNSTIKKFFDNTSSLIRRTSVNIQLKDPQLKHLKAFFNTMNSLFPSSILLNDQVEWWAHILFFKEGMAQEFPKRMRQFCVLHWEEVITKILPLCRLCVHRVCYCFSQKLQYRFGVHNFRGFLYLQIPYVYTVGS